MKTVIYNSRLASMLLKDDFAAIMLFGLVLVKGDSFSKKQQEHEKVHQGQFADCFGAGLVIAIITMFSLFAFNVLSWWMLLLCLVPATLFYFLYVIEWLIRLIQYKSTDKAYSQTSFEREAYDFQEEYLKPCAERRKRASFNWSKYYKC